MKGRFYVTTSLPRKWSRKIFPESLMGRFYTTTCWSYSWKVFTLVSSSFLQSQTYGEHLYGKILHQLVQTIASYSGKTFLSKYTLTLWEIHASILYHLRHIKNHVIFLILRVFHWYIMIGKLLRIYTYIASYAMAIAMKMEKVIWLCT